MRCMFPPTPMRCTPLGRTVPVELGRLLRTAPSPNMSANPPEHQERTAIFTLERSVGERPIDFTGSGCETRAVSDRARAALAESPLAIIIGTAALFWLYESGWLSDLSRTTWVAFLSLWLLAPVSIAVFGVVRHAEALAVHLGEPLGTLVLTLSVISVEVMMISVVVLTGGNNPTLARDTMYAVAMIVLGGLVGLCLLLGGLRHREQEYNLQGAHAFLGLIIPLAVLVLILPAYTRSTSEKTYSDLQASLFAVMALGLYGVFL